jgi:predicted aminopeptidase
MTPAALRRGLTPPKEPRPIQRPAGEALHLKRLLGLLLVACVVSACASADVGPGYYWQSMTGHLRLMGAARPVQDWLDDPATPVALKQRLMLAQRMRAFASSELALPDNASYRRYADLRRKAAVYNVVAAPELSLQLHNWCFPVAGCVGYRGYFDEAEARAFAARLPPGLDVAVYPVPAYSTLGWMNWAGGDPLLNTFIGYPEGELARMVFHELAHQVLYVADDTPFNESFATAVERLGGARWLAQADGNARQAYADFDARRQAFRAEALATRQRLQALYDSPLSDDDKRQGKVEILGAFRERYGQLKQGWGGYKGYDAWVAQANNATFGAQAAYDQWVPAFEELFQREGHDFPRFYEAVQRLARLDKEARAAALEALAPAAPVQPH